MQRRILRPLVIALAIAAPLGLAFAQKKTDGKYSHPNLVAADKLCAQAFAKLEAAQVANEFDLGGHAKKAKDLIQQAQEEIRLAKEKAGAGKR
jgi:hypothetical protein